MRKLILVSLMTAVAIPAVASAQSNGEIRRDRREVQEQREELRDAQRGGDRGEIREQQRDLRDAREELREDRQDRRDVRNDRADNRDMRGDRRDDRFNRRNSYVAPYRNWRYSTVTVGYQLRPGFYGSRYHIANPRHYRLQPAARNQRWIRYGDDLLLVNVRNGRVLQVIHNRHW